MPVADAGEQRSWPLKPSIKPAPSPFLRRRPRRILIPRPCAADPRCPRSNSLRPMTIVAAAPLELAAPERAPVFGSGDVAWLMSLLWLAAVAYYTVTTHLPTTEQSGGLLAPGNMPATLALALAAVLPVILVFAVAGMVRRAQEMRIAARAMTEAAMRLAQPETIAADSVFTLGQAVRREVASMGDGIERAVARASELEALVHSEVAQLERSYTDNELKIRKLLDDLASQQTNFGDSAETLRRSIGEAQDSLNSELRTVAQRITDQVAEARLRVTNEMDDRGRALADTLLRTGENVSDRIATTSAEMTRTISDYGQQLVSEISDRSQSVAVQIGAVGREVAERIDMTSQKRHRAIPLGCRGRHEPAGRCSRRR